MSYKKSTGTSLWERPMAGYEPEGHGRHSHSNSNSMSRHRKDEDHFISSRNPRDMTRDELPSTRRTREAASQPGSERDPQSNACRCPASRPRNGCRNCKIGSTSNVLGVLNRGREEFKKQMRAADRQAQPGTRTRNPEGHVRPF